MWLLLAIALAEPTVRGTHVSEGRLSERIVRDDAELVLLYGGEQRGDQGDCGCPGDPRGSLGRLEAYAEAVRSTGAPVLQLDPGNWLDDPVGVDQDLRADALVRNEHMVSAMEAGNWTALNVTFRDLPWLGRSGRWPEGVVSANARGFDALPTHRIVEVGGRTVAITGVTHWAKDYLQPDGLEALDPVEALVQLLPALREEADVVVVMTYGLGRRIKEVVALDADIVVEADSLRSRFGPVYQDGTVLVRSNEQTQMLGELRLEWDGDGLARAWERSIDLDGDVPWPRAWRRRHRKAHSAVRDVQEQLFSP